MARVCDCFPELKEITAARERRYVDHPERAAPEGPQSFVEVKVTSIGQLNELVECKKSGHKFIISEPVHVGGQNVAPTPLEFLLSGAVGCYAAVFAFYAAKMGVNYESFEATARATFDVRGHMIPGAPPSSFQTVTIDIRVVSDAAPAELQEIERLALQGCPGIATLRNPVAVESRLDIQRPTASAAAAE
jgi:putative redox protein